MKSLRSFLASAGVFLIALIGCAQAALEDDEKAETWAQMHRAWVAIMAYQKDHGQVPDYLSDLIPDYLPNADALISPTEKRTGRHGDFDHKDPKFRNSFCYEFSAKIYRSKTATKRESKEAQMKEFGAVVPILRCFLYDRVLNIAYSGDAYESSVSWEISPGAKALMTRLGGGPGFVNGEFTPLTVVDAETQSPLAGAEVRLTSRAYGGFPLPDRTLRTGPDGTVRVPLGPAQPSSRALKFRIFKPGYFSPWELWNDGALPEEAVIGLERGTTIGGIVTATDGTPLSGAQIVITVVSLDADGKSTKMELATEPSSPEGRWSCDRLPPVCDQLSLRVRHPAAWTTTFEAAERTFLTKISIADLRRSTAELRLRPTAVLQGTVTTADGKPVVGAEVIATPLGFSGPAKTGPTKTDAAGHYALPRMEAGEVTVLIFPNDGAPAGARRTSRRRGHRATSA